MLKAFPGFTVFALVGAFLGFGFGAGLGFAAVPFESFPGRGFGRFICPSRTSWMPCPS